MLNLDKDHTALIRILRDLGYLPLPGENDTLTFTYKPLLLEFIVEGQNTLRIRPLTDAAFSLEVEAQYNINIKWAQTYVQADEDVTVHFAEVNNDMVRAKILAVLTRAIQIVKIPGHKWGKKNA